MTHNTSPIEVTASSSGSAYIDGIFGRNYSGVADAALMSGLNIVNVAGGPFLHDYLRRVVASDNGVLTTVASVPTTSFVHRIGVIWDQSEEIIGCLRSIVRWQKSRLDYSELHTAYVMGALSEEEFVKDAEAFAAQIVVLPKEEVATCLQRVFAATEVRFSASDLADLMNIEVEAVFQALSHLREQGALADGQQSLALE